MFRPIPELKIKMTRKEYNTAVDLHADGLYRFILKSMSDTEAAKDVVQDVFTKLWIKHENVEFGKSKSYLFTAGYNTMIDVFRKNKRLTQVDESAVNLHSHTKQYTDLGEILEKALQTLPEIHRSVVMLRDYEGYNYQEIGEIVNLTESQVKVYIFRGRKALQQYLKSIETVLE